MKKMVAMHFYKFYSGKLQTCFSPFLSKKRVTVISELWSTITPALIDIFKFFTTLKGFSRPLQRYYSIPPKSATRLILWGCYTFLSLQVLFVTQGLTLIFRPQPCITWNSLSGLEFKVKCYCHHYEVYRPATLQERQIWMNMKKNLNVGKKIWMISLPPPPPPRSYRRLMKSIHQEGRNKSPPSWYRGVNIYPQFKTKKNHTACK